MASWLQGSHPKQQAKAEVCLDKKFEPELSTQTKHPPLHTPKLLGGLNVLLVVILLGLKE